MTDDSDKYLFPPKIRKVMMEMHHEEWDKLKASDPVRAIAVEQTTISLHEAFPELDNAVLSDLFAFVVSSMKGAAERGATLVSVLNGYADICSELVDIEYKKGLETVDDSTE